MDEDAFEAEMSQAFGSIQQVVAGLRRQLEGLELRHAADPGGELSATARMLRLKRGCRRG